MAAASTFFPLLHRALLPLLSKATTVPRHPPEQHSSRRHLFHLDLHPHLSKVTWTQPRELHARQATLTLLSPLILALVGSQPPPS